MSEAPKICAMCPINASDYAPCKAGVWPDLATNRLPGPQCPFVRLDAKDGEILVLKNQLLKAQREATELRELLDEHDIDIDTEIT